MNDPYVRRKLIGAILITILLQILLIGEAMRDRTLRRWAFAWLGVVLLGLTAIVTCIWLLMSPVLAQDGHGHRPEHLALHHKFYSTWMMPDNRGVSCCHDEDCEPAEAHQENGIWYARKVSEVETYPEYVRIPENKIEHDRDTPDGQSHMCGRRYGFSNMQMSVFCFIAGSGG